MDLTRQRSAATSKRSRLARKSLSRQRRFGGSSESKKRPERMGTVHSAPINGMLIPCVDVDLYLSLGWRLTDEPRCGHVRMLLPARVPLNVKKMPGADASADR